VGGAERAILIDSVVITLAIVEYRRRQRQQHHGPGVRNVARSASYCWIAMDHGASESQYHADEKIMTMQR
jgi:hypothetical protein